jgi:hypothetical protein
VSAYRLSAETFFYSGEGRDFSIRTALDPTGLGNGMVGTSSNNRKWEDLIEFQVLEGYGPRKWGGREVGTREVLGRICAVEEKVGGEVKVCKMDKLEVLARLPNPGVWFNGSKGGIERGHFRHVRKDVIVLKSPEGGVCDRFENIGGQPLVILQPGGPPPRTCQAGLFLRLLQAPEVGYRNA